MKKLTLLLILTAFGMQLASAQVKELQLTAVQLSDLISSADAIHSIENVSANQIDSVITLFPSLAAIERKDLEIIYSFLVPQLTPNITDNIIAFKQCQPYAKKYMDKISASIPSIAEKYPNTNEKVLANNLSIFFQYYLYLGLSKNNSLNSLEKSDANDVSAEALDALFLQARGSIADEMIYFVMAHSSQSLFDLIATVHRIPTYDYSIN